MRKVLICDDYETVSKVYFDLLKATYEVEATTDPKEIVLRGNRFRPDLLLVNTTLPEVDATEICKLAKEELGIPVILMLDKEAVATIKIDSCEADQILIKPVEQQELIVSINRLIALNQ